MNKYTMIQIEKWNSLTKEQKADIQISVCKAFDQMQKNFAENDLLAFVLHDDMQDMMRNNNDLKTLFDLVKKML